MLSRFHTHNFMRIGCCVVAFLSCIVATAQAAPEVSGGPTPDSTKVFKRRWDIHFKVDRADIDMGFHANDSVMAGLKAKVDSIVSSNFFLFRDIHVEATSSPEGNNLYNINLANRRASALAGYMENLFGKNSVSPTLFAFDQGSEDWDTFWEIVEQDSLIPDRDKIMALKDAPLDFDAKEQKLREYRNGFFYILRNHGWRMRSSRVELTYTAPFVYVPFIAPVQGKAASIEDRAVPAPAPVVAQEPEHQKKMILSARTNLLVPALNVGIEVPIKYNWSVGVDYYFPWWLSKNNMYCIEMLGLFIDGKYWFGKNRSEEDKLSGHAIGLYAGAGYYDFQWKRSGHQGEYIDVGVDYTYGLPVAKGKLRMEFNVGLGYIYTVARHYTPTDNYGELIKDPGIKHRKYNFFGPTRASVSFIVPIRVRTAKKGGAK